MFNLQNIPDWRDRIKIGISGGAIRRTVLTYDNSGNEIIGGGGSGNFMITEAGDLMITEAGDFMITES
jgi:hypothetical protein